MMQRLAGRGWAAALAVLAAMLETVDVSTKALAPWLMRASESRTLAILFGLTSARAVPCWLRVSGALALSLAVGAWLGGGGEVVFAAATYNNWQDLLDIRFARLYNERFRQLPDMIARFFRVVGPGESPQRATYRTSSAGAFGDVPEFTGSVTYDDAYQGYDRVLTPIEYASGYQIERRLFDHDEHGIMDQKPRGLATAVQRTRQKHAAQVFNNATSVDTKWNNFTENVALASNSHTTTAPGVSAASGFDNLVTTAFSATALAALRIQMVGYRDDRGNRIAVNPSMIIHPPDIYDLVHEVIKSEGQPDTANNASNVHYNAWEAVEWNYLTDTNNYAVVDPVMMKDALVWYDELPAEFAMVESFDELIGKWRAYLRYGAGHDDWRFLCYAQVS